jgi:hypothetical protein
VVAVTGVIDRVQARHRAVPRVQGVAGVTEIMVRHWVEAHEPGALRDDLLNIRGGVLPILLTLVRRHRESKGEASTPRQFLKKPLEATPAAFLCSLTLVEEMIKSKGCLNVV